MKITFLDFDDIRNPLLGAGQARATFNVGKELTHAGHTVLSICSRYPGYQDRVEEGITYRHIGLGSRFLKLNNLFYILTLPFAVWQLNEKNCDIIVECFTAPISTLFSPIFTKVPVVVLPSMFNAIEFSKKYHFPFHWVEKLGARLYQYMLPYSEIDLGKMKLLNPKIIYKIVGQGVSETFFKIKSKKPRYILFFARLDIEQKGIDLLLEAYAKVEDRIGYPLVIAGHGPDKGRVEKLIKDLGLERNVTLIGFIDGAKKAQVFSEALYALMPSRHDEMNLGCLEVLAAGLPVIAFDLPESKWLSDSVSWKATPYDVGEYAMLLLKATQQNEITRKKAACREFAKKFTWKNVAIRFLDFFKEITKK